MVWNLYFGLTYIFCRICNAATPEIARNLSDTCNVSRITSRSRTTMMPSEIAQSKQLLSKLFGIFSVEFH